MYGFDSVDREAYSEAEGGSEGSKGIVGYGEIKRKFTIKIKKNKKSNCRRYENDLWIALERELSWKRDSC